MYISFTHPGNLWFLFAIPILIFLHFFSLKSIKKSSLKFANFEAISRIKGIDIYSKNIFVLILDILFVSLLIMAVSGLTIHKEVDASSFSFVIAIDNSESMSAVDLPPDRISAAKETAIDFVSNLPFETYVGVLSFSGSSKIEKELIKDKQELKAVIEEIELSSEGGTDIYDAVLNSEAILRDRDNKAIILLSDGQINIGNIKEAVDYGIDNQIIIHTIGVGTVEGGSASFGMSKLDEESLKSLAYSTGGSYFRAEDKTALKNSFDSIVGKTRKLGSINLSLYLIMTGIILFLIKQFLVGIRSIGWWEKNFSYSISDDTVSFIRFMGYKLSKADFPYET